MELSVLPATERAEIDLRSAAGSLRTTRPPAQNSTEIATDRRWEAAHLACQLFDDAVESIAAQVGPFVNQGCAAEFMQFLVRERIAIALAGTLRRLSPSLVVRFDEQRIVDNERYVVFVTDILTGEREEFGWTFGGGQAALEWKVERLLALAGKGVRA